jgi:signal transduction histidine kinase
MALGWTLSRAVPITAEDGEITEWLGAATDITERKRSEEALLNAERLASIGRMAATISHEINNPLEAVTNLLYLASKSEGLPATAREQLEQADAELRRVAHIARQALGFYRESAAPAPIDISQLMESTLDLLKGKINGRIVSIKTVARNAGHSWSCGRIAAGLLESSGPTAWMQSRMAAQLNCESRRARCRRTGRPCASRLPITARALTRRQSTAFLNRYTQRRGPSEQV